MGSNALNLAFRGTQVGAMTAETLVRVLAELAEKAEASRMRNQFLKLAKENAEDVRGKYFNPSEYNAIKRALDRNKDFIPAAMYQDSKTNKVVCFYMKKDEAKMTEIFEKARVSEQSLFSSSEIVNNHLGQRLITVKDLSEAQKNTLADYLEANNLEHSVEVSSIAHADKSYVITCLGDTQERLDIIREGLEKTARDEAGITGKYHLANIQMGDNVSNIISEAISKNDSYIVSASNPNYYIHMTESGYSYINNGKEIESIAKGSARFSKSLFTRAQDMPVPLLYENNSFMNKDGIDLMHEASDRFQFIPKSANDKVRIALEEKARALVALKMGLDNGGQYKIQSSFYNSDVSFTEFFAIEQINDAYEAKMGKPLDTETLERYKQYAEELDSADDSQKLYAKEYISDIYDRCNDLVNDDRLEVFIPLDKVENKDNSLDEYINEFDENRDDILDGLDTPEIE